MALVTMWYIHQNCNFGRGNDNRPLEVRGDYLLSDTAMMVISHAYVVRECLISEDPPKPNKLLCWVSLIQMKLQGAPPQVFGLYKPWPVLTVNVSYLLYQVYDMSSFSIKCSVSVCSSCSGYISHMFLVKKCFFDDWLRGFFCFSAAGFWAAWHAPQQYLGCCARVPIGSLGNLDIAWW